ncbi:MAG: phosphoribosylaminoimidazolesuccinocarboxamide synthase, partial [Actinomycetota bacterium]
MREIFDVGVGGMLLFVATDRISAYDVVMAQGIPDKGKLLTGMSVFWFEMTKDICPNHCLASCAQGLMPGLVQAVVGIEGRFMIVERLEMLPVEFVVRGYLTGSGWADYRRSGAVCGVKLPSGLEEAEKLPEPIFTPATKATQGHDQNITEEQAAALCPPGTLEVGKDYAIDLYL